MNTLNPLEIQLRSWTPRPPSPSLERRLFRPAPAAGPSWLSQAWLSPVAACLALGAVVLGLRGQPPRLVDRAHGPLVAMILSNQNYAAYLPGSFQRQQNRWDTFEWTNPGRFPSSGGPFLRVKQTSQTPHGQD